MTKTYADIEREYEALTPDERKTLCVSAMMAIADMQAIEDEDQDLPPARKAG